MVRSNVHRFEAIRALVLVELFAIGLVASTAAPAFAQAATFEKAIATPQASYAQDAKQMSDGGYVVGANYCSGSCYFALISKLDSSGNLQWQKQYQLPGFQTQLNASWQTSDGATSGPASSRTSTVAPGVLSSRSLIQTETSSGRTHTADSTSPNQPTPARIQVRANGAARGCALGVLDD